MDEVNSNLTICRIRSDPQINSSQITLTNVTGNKNLSSDNVDVFLIDKYQMNYFPLNFSSFFTKIQKLLANNCKLHEIKPEDLQGLNQLYHIDLSGNELQSIEANTFIFSNIDLKHLDLHNNYIQFVHVNWIKVTGNLKFLDFSNNNCSNKEAENLYWKINLLVLNIIQDCHKDNDGKELKELQKRFDEVTAKNSKNQEDLQESTRDGRKGCPNISLLTLEKEQKVLKTIVSDTNKNLKTLELEISNHAGYKGIKVDNINNIVTQLPGAMKTMQNDIKKILVVSSSIEKVMGGVETKNPSSEAQDFYKSMKNISDELSMKMASLNNEKLTEKVRNFL